MHLHRGNRLNAVTKVDITGVILSHNYKKKDLIIHAMPHNCWMLDEIRNTSKLIGLNLRVIHIDVVAMYNNVYNVYRIVGD